MASGEEDFQISARNYTYD